MSARWPLRVLGADERAAQGELVLRRVEFGAVPAFAADDLQVAFQTFLRSARFMTARNTDRRGSHLGQDKPTAENTVINMRTKYVEQTHDQYLLPEVNALAGRKVSRILFKDRSDISRGENC